MRAAILAFVIWLAACIGSCTLTPFVAPTVPGNTPAAAVYRIVSSTYTCSAVAIGPRTLLTAKHCGPGPFVSAAASLLAVVEVDPGRDVQTLYSPYVELEAWIPIATVPPTGGDAATIIGYGCDKRLAARGLRYVSYNEYEGRACKGDSGGAIVNANGELLGITSMYFPDEHRPLVWAVDVVGSGVGSRAQ